MSIKNFRERSPLIIGIISIAGIVAGTTFAFYINKLPFVHRSYTIEAEFADAAGLNVENQVRVAGIKVGTVEEVELIEDRVLVTMKINNDVQIPEDAFAEIKLATLLGTKFVDIDGKGSDELLEDGDRIALENTSVPYEIYQAANQGTNVVEDLDGELLNDLLVELTELTGTVKEEVGVALEGLNELGGGLNAKQEEFRSLLSNAEELTGLLDEEGDQIVSLIDSSNEVLGSLAGQREEIQGLLETTKLMSAELDDLLKDNRTNVDSILAKLHNALVVLERNVDDLDVALEYAGPASRYFGIVFSQGRWGDIFSCAILLAGSCEG